MPQKTAEPTPIEREQADLLADLAVDAYCEVSPAKEAAARARIATAIADARQKGVRETLEALRREIDRRMPNG